MSFFREAKHTNWGNFDDKLKAFKFTTKDHPETVGYPLSFPLSSFKAIRKMHAAESSEKESEYSFYVRIVAKQETSVWDVASSYMKKLGNKIDEIQGHGSESSGPVARENDPGFLFDTAFFYLSEAEVKDINAGKTITKKVKVKGSEHGSLANKKCKSLPGPTASADIKISIFKTK